MSIKPAVKVGDLVQFTYGTTLVTGKVIEDRGPIGIKGRRMYRVRFPVDAEFQHEMEMSADRFEIVRDKAPAG